MIPYWEIISLYFFGLCFVIFIYLLGLGLTRKLDLSLFEVFFIGYLSFLSIYAIIKTNFYSLSILIPIWLLFYFYLFKHQSANTVSHRYRLEQLLIVLTMWTIIFLFKAVLFWNVKLGLPNMLFADYPYYMKLAEAFSLSGHENALGHKNILFDEIKFIQPYRTHDLWLPSIGLDFTGSPTYFVWELFYSPTVYFMSSLSIFSICNHFKKKIGVSVIISVLSLFAFSGFWYRYFINLPFNFNSGSWDPIGIFSYPKLAIVHAVYLMAILSILRRKYYLANFQLFVLIFLVQSTIAVVPLVFTNMILLSFGMFHYQSDLKISERLFLFLNATLFGFFYLIYRFNAKLETTFFGISNSTITNNEDIFDLCISFVKKMILLFVSYYWLSVFIIIIFSLLIIKTKTNRLNFYLIVFLCFVSTTTVYTYFKNIGDAYQFSTNVFGPFLISLIIVFFISYNTACKTMKFIMISLFLVICLSGVYSIVYQNNPIYSPHRVEFYSKSFLDAVSKDLLNLKNTYGVRYYGPEEQIPLREDFPMHEAGFLKLFGRHFDVFNLNLTELSEIPPVTYRGEKYKLYSTRSAINIFRKKILDHPQTLDSIIQLRFIKDHEIGYCLTTLSKENLPHWLQKEIVYEIYDLKSLLYYYRLIGGNEK